MKSRYPRPEMSVRDMRFIQLFDMLQDCFVPIVLDACRYLRTEKRRKEPGEGCALFK